MGYQTPRGIPVPFGFEGNNVPADLLAVAQRLDALFDPHTYTEIGALDGVDLWDGRRVFQTDTGTLRPWTGLYSYKASTGVWQPLIPTSSAAYTPLQLSGGPTLGTGAVNSGRYTKFGTLVVGQFAIYLGSGYVNGTFLIQAPVPFKDSGLTGPTDDTAVGSMILYDFSATSYYLFNLELGVGTDDITFAGELVGGAGQFQATSPVTLANQDNLAGFFFYEGVET